MVHRKTENTLLIMMLIFIPPKTNAVDPWCCDYSNYKQRHLFALNNIPSLTLSAILMDEMGDGIKMSFKCDNR